MARKPHNYTHFQSLVSQLKEQNDDNFATLSSHLEAQTSILQSLKGAKLKELQQDQADLRKDKENRLEGKKGGKKEIKMPGFLKGGKGIMGGIGQFLSTALLGIPGGLRKFMPRALGIPLMFGLARGMAAMLVGPHLIEALSAAFDQKSFSGGFEAFINSYFTPSGTPYKTLWGAASGGAGMGLLAGLAILGPRGAIIGGILGGALTGLNHILKEDKSDSKMKSGDVMTKIKTHLKENIKTYAGVGMALKGAMWGWRAGPAGMIAGAIIGAGIGIIGAGTIMEMMEVEAGGEDNYGVIFKQGLINYLKSDEFKAVQDLAPWAGGAAGAALFAGLGPAGMIAGMILGAGAGIVAGPVLLEALTSKEGTGKKLASVAGEALWNYLKSSKYLRGGLFGAALFGGAGAMGLGPVGMIAGAIIGAVIGVLTTWITYAVSDFVGPKLAKVFGLDTITMKEGLAGVIGGTTNTEKDREWGRTQKKRIAKQQAILNDLEQRSGKKGALLGLRAGLSEQLVTANPTDYQYRFGSMGKTKGTGGLNHFGVMSQLKDEYLIQLKKLGGKPTDEWGKVHDRAARAASGLITSSEFGEKDSHAANLEEAFALRLLAANDALMRIKAEVADVYNQHNPMSPQIQIGKQGGQEFVITNNITGEHRYVPLTAFGLKDYASN